MPRKGSFLTDFVFYRRFFYMVKNLWIPRILMGGHIGGAVEVVHVVLVGVASFWLAFFTG